jgi:beta-lactamase class C
MNRSRREMLRLSVLGLVGAGLGSGCGARVLTPSVEEQFDPLLGPFSPSVVHYKRLLDFYVAKYMSQAQYTTAGFYYGGHEFFRGYKKGAPSAQVDISWIFSIGSNTKVFTATLLALQVVNSKKRLQDKVVRYLPAEVQQKGTVIKEISLVELATHTASFPDYVSVEAHNTLFHDAPPTRPQIDWWITWTNPDDPHKHDVCAGMKPGTCWNYSDWGFITLGFGVCDSNAKPGGGYNVLLRKGITDPLRLPHTRPNEKVSVKGHLGDGKIGTPPADLKSNAPEMLRFIKANLGKLSGVPQELADAMALAHQHHWRDPDNPELDMGLAWQMPSAKPSLPQLLWKNGGGGGFSSFMGIIPELALGVVLLSNSALSDPTSCGIDVLEYLRKNA